MNCDDCRISLYEALRRIVRGWRNYLRASWRLRRMTV
jgi:hypothetical protein